MKKQPDLPDALSQLGALALGSRLRRLADILYRQAALSLKRDGLDLAPNHIPVLMTLHAHGAMNVVDLSRRLRTSQPGVTRMLTDLNTKRIVSLKKSKLDQRQTEVGLTPIGKSLMATLSEDYCRRVEAAARELYEGVSPDFLEHIEAIESALETRGLHDRIERKPTS